VPEAFGEEIAQNCSAGQVTQGLLASREEPIGAEGEEKRPPSLGGRLPFCFSGWANLCHESLVLFRHDSHGNPSNASVDAIRQPAGGRPGKEVSILFQGNGSSGQRQWYGNRRPLQVFFGPVDDSIGDVRLVFLFSYAMAIARMDDQFSLHPIALQPAIGLQDPA